MQLRPYQADAYDAIRDAWQEYDNICAVMPTGAGKTVLFSNAIRDHDTPSCAIAHRQELVSQISLALGRYEVKHRIVGPQNVIRNISKLHFDELGKIYIDPNAWAGVAGVDTLLRRAGSLQSWLKSVRLWVQDECHHVLRENKWGKAVDLFYNAKGLGVTATPTRADGKGLGRHADGVFDHMVEGPTMRDLINMSWLTEYRIFAPPSDLDLSTVKTGSDGDYSRPSMVIAVKKSHIIGDVVTHYLRIAKGKLGITFATDVETATDIARQFNEAGIPAEVVSAKTPDTERQQILKRFARREILQLVNVDLFGEGFDLPAIEVVSMARPTQSYALYAQQFGRGLRRMDGKEYAIIIDHVGNVVRHGLPDAARVWTLDRRDTRSKSTADPDVIPVRSCPQCTAVYERIYAACPECGFKPIPASRSAPEFVDGDLSELDAETLARMRGDVDANTVSVENYASWITHQNIPQVAKKHRIRSHQEKLHMIEALQGSIAWWAGKQKLNGYTDSMSYRLFTLRFGIDVLTAQTLNATDANKLIGKINEDLIR